MIKKSKDAYEFEQPSITGRKYDIEVLLPDQSFVYGKLDGEHGERVSGDTPRLYYIVSGKGKVEIDSEMTLISEGDLVIIPPRTKYNYQSIDGPVEFILYMEKH